MTLALFALIVVSVSLNALAQVALRKAMTFRALPALSEPIALGTSLVAAFVFYGWGLGLYGHVSRFQAWLLVPVVWIAMLAWSKPWLERFRYGPFEWAWRTLSRLQLQPMRKPLPA